jgi:glycosyltransferase involved in cell wall biosynthesis
VPAVLEVNAPLVEEQAVHRGLVDRAGAEAVARAALSSATVVACVSEQVARWAATRGAAAPQVVPNGVDPVAVRPSPRRPAAAGADRFVVGFVGTLKPWHGLDVLLDALALLDPTWHLLLVGDGPEGPALRTQADRLGLAVETTGAVDPTAVPGLLHRMDVAVAPYPALADPYFSPLKLYEYLAAGLPVVASDVGQVPDALEGGRLGVLVPPGDPVALAAALTALRADEPCRALLRGRAREAAVTRHSWSGVLDRLLALLPVAA